MLLNYGKNKLIRIRKDFKMKARNTILGTLLAGTALLAGGIVFGGWFRVERAEIEKVQDHGRSTILVNVKDRDGFKRVYITDGKNQYDVLKDFEDVDKTIEFVWGRGRDAIGLDPSQAYTLQVEDNKGYIKEAREREFKSR